MADVVLRALRGGRGQGPREHPTVLAVEPERREKGDCSIIVGQSDPETCHWAWRMSHRQGVGMSHRQGVGTD